MNYYEVLYIVNPNYGKDKISEIINDINTHIQSKKHYFNHILCFFVIQIIIVLREVKCQMIPNAVQVHETGP